MLKNNGAFFCQICSGEVDENVLFLDCFHFICNPCAAVYKNLDKLRPFYSFPCKLCSKTTIFSKKTPLNKDYKKSSSSLSDTINRLKSQMSDHKQSPSISTTPFLNKDTQEFDNSLSSSQFDHKFEETSIEEDILQREKLNEKLNENKDKSLLFSKKKSPKFADKTDDFLEFDENQCEIHKENVMIYCLDDKAFLCMSCVFLDKKHKTHRTLPIKNATKEILAESHLIFSQKLKCEENSLENELNKAKINRKFLDLALRKSFDRIKEEFDGFYKKIKIKEQFLIEENQRFFDEKTRILESRISNISNLQSIFGGKLKKKPDFNEENLLGNVSFIRNYQDLCKYLGILSQDSQRILLNEEEIKGIDFTNNQRKNLIDSIEALGNISLCKTSKNEDFTYILTNKSLKTSKNLKKSQNNHSLSPKIPIKPLNSERKVSFSHNKQRFLLENKGFFYDSLILKRELRISQVFLCILPEDLLIKEKFYSNLLYRLTRDGANSLTFHLKCDGKKPIIGLIHAGNCIFGFFTEIPFKQMEEFAVFEGNCWIFSIKNKLGFHPMKFVKKKEGVSVVQKKESPIIGKNDLYIK